LAAVADFATVRVVFAFAAGLFAAPALPLPAVVVLRVVVATETSRIDIFGAPTVGSAAFAWPYLVCQGKALQVAQRQHHWPKPE
jgi:hypothetical protein